MYSDDGTNWTFFPEIIHYDGPALGTNFLQWGERYLLMNWGYGYCEPDHRLTPGGPNLMIYETPADLARQSGRRKEDGSCENTMNLIEAEPGCGYTVDADSGKGPLEGKHIVEGDTLYHFCVAWNDSAPSSELTWGKNWENGQIDLWKAYIPDGAMPVSVERQRHAVTGTGTSARPIRVRIRTGMSPPDDRFTLYTAQGRKIGGAFPSPGTGGSSVATAVPATQGGVTHSLSLFYRPDGGLG